ncbi:MAG: hypothetical protein ACFCU7_13425 [Pleurocapsa sp.]
MINFSTVAILLELFAISISLELDLHNLVLKFQSDRAKNNQYLTAKGAAKHPENNYSSSTT